MGNLEEQYKEDRKLTLAMVLATFERDSVPQGYIDRYVKCYDAETAVGLEIAEWLDNSREPNAD
tara:strand:+ start:308 stop:499 length:192 start_codon:yes stop_codon:yes gene_type:complete